MAERIGEDQRKIARVGYPRPRVERRVPSPRSYRMPRPREYGRKAQAEDITGLWTFDDVLLKKPFADVRAYGATGDGTTDDTIAIQACFDAANTVVFPRASYKATALAIDTNKSKIYLRGSTLFLNSLTVNGDDLIIDLEDGAIHGNLRRTTADGGEPIGEVEILVVDASVFEIGDSISNSYWGVNDVIITDIVGNVVTIDTPITIALPDGADVGTFSWDVLLDIHGENFKLRDGIVEETVGGYAWYFYNTAVKGYFDKITFRNIGMDMGSIYSTALYATDCHFGNILDAGKQGPLLKGTNPKFVATRCSFALNNSDRVVGLRGTDAHPISNGVIKLIDCEVDTSNTHPAPHSSRNEEVVGIWAQAGAVHKLIELRGCAIESYSKYIVSPKESVSPAQIVERVLIENTHISDGETLTYFGGNNNIVYEDYQVIDSVLEGLKTTTGKTDVIKFLRTTFKDSVSRTWFRGSAILDKCYLDHSSWPTTVGATIGDDIFNLQSGAQMRGTFKSVRGTYDIQFYKNLAGQMKWHAIINTIYGVAGAPAGLYGDDWLIPIYSRILFSEETRQSTGIVTKSNETTLTVNAAATDVDITVASVAGMAVDDYINVLMNSDYVHAAQITNIAALVVTMSVALPEDADSGQPVCAYTYERYAHKVVAGQRTDLTISGGVITITGSHHRIDTEGGDPADDLDTINGGVPGQFLTLHSVSAARDPTVKHATGNIWLEGGFNFIMGATRSFIYLFYDSAVGWIEVARRN